MPKVVVPNDFAAPIRRSPGSYITFFNQSGTDVYFDEDSNRLLSAVPGQPPDGTKVAAGTSYQYFRWPDTGIVWVRATQYTTLEVQP